MTFPFTLADKTYQQLKWFVTIVLPAFGTFYVTLGSNLGLPNPEGVAAATLAITTFLGAILGISSHNFNKTNVAEGQMVVQPPGSDGVGYSLQLEKTPEELSQLRRITFDVVAADED